MTDETLIIKNMVCPRCIEAVEQLLRQHDIPYTHVSLGRVELVSPLNEKKRDELDKDLQEAGFKLLDDPKASLVNDIKHEVIERLRTMEGPTKDSFSQYLSDQLSKDFTYLSRLFSSVEGITLERYILRVKTELVKELLIYDELTLSEIAFRLDYSSTAHLSSQFKKETGMTPTDFKKLSEPDRTPLDKL